MEISWKRINDDTRNIIEEFERLYTYERDFAECEKLLRDIFSIYSSKYNIKLDENQNFDHIFQQLLSGIQNIIEDYTPSELADRIEARKVDEFFAKMSSDIFQTAEIRGRLKEIDPSNLEIIKALEQGIQDSTQRRDQLITAYNRNKGIEEEIFGKDLLLEHNIDTKLNIIENLNAIETKLKEIKGLQDALKIMTPGVGNNDNDIQLNQNRIDELFQEVERAKSGIKNTGLVENARLENIKLEDVDNAIAEANRLSTDMDVDVTADFTTLQNNLQKVSSKYSDMPVLAGIDVSKLDPSTEAGRKAIRESYKPFREMIAHIQLNIDIHQKEIDIFDAQIKTIREEQQVVEMEIPTDENVSRNVPEDIERKLADDHEYYKKMVHAQMYGDDDYETAYEYCLEKIFKRHTKSKMFVLRNEDGTPITGQDSHGNKTLKTGTYKTIDYAGIQKEIDTMLKHGDPTFVRISKKIPLSTTEDLVKFLQLEEYKDKLERYTRLKAGDKLAITEYKSYDAWKNAKTPEEKNSARTALLLEQDRDIEYLKSYHYAPNEYSYKRQHHATAGKIGETYLPLEQYSKEKSLAQNAKVAIHNLYAYTRWQNPFKAKGILKFGGIMLANTGNLITMIPRMITKATGKVISNFAYDDENANPNPYAGRRDVRRGARVDYYREQGDGAFKARFKGWTDELPFRKARRKDVENIIQDRQLEEIDKSNRAAYVAGVTVDGANEIQQQQETVKKNREIRTADIRMLAGTQEVQGDVIRDVAAVDEKTLSQRVIQRTALEYAGVDSSYVSNTGSRDTAKNERRNLQFVKDKPKIEGTKTIVKPVVTPIEQRWGRKKGAVVAADPIGNAIRSREIKNTLTRWYTLEEMALLKGQSALVNWGISKIKDIKMVTEQVRVQDGTQIVDKGHYEQSTTYTEGVLGTREGNAVANLDMGDLSYSEEAFFEHTASSSHSPVKWLETPTAQNTQAMALDFVIPNNLSASEYEALSKLGYKVGDRIVYSVADEATKNLCEATGRVYASKYIDGMFQFTNQTNILDAIEQYFPEGVDQAFNIILDSEAYAGDAGVKFFTDSFSTSHGITSIMETMKGWGTGWGLESINAEALESARTTVDIMGQIPVTEKVWVERLVEEPIYKIVDQMKEIPDEAKVRLKKILTGTNNGLKYIGMGTTAADLVREAKTKKERARETYQGEIR